MGTARVSRVVPGCDADAHTEQIKANDLPDSHAVKRWT